MSEKRRNQDVNSAMKVWLIQVAEVLPLEEGARKMRTSMLADALLSRGHQVLWWTSAFDHFNKDWIFPDDTLRQLREGYQLIALKGRGYHKNVSLARYIDHRTLARKFRKHAEKMEKPDIIVASTPPHDIAYAAASYAKNHGVPVILDIRDPWPDIFLGVAPVYLRPLLSIVLRRDFQMTRKAMKMADGLVGVTRRLLNFGLNYACREGGERDRIFYLGSFRKEVSTQVREEMASRIGGIKDKFIVVFIGTFGHYNHPGILVDCAKMLSETNALFVLAGTGELYHQIKREAAGLSNLVLPGWLNQEEISALLDIAHVGICPTPRKRDDAFHNKVFLYLSAGLPIISAFQGELREVIEKRRLGFYYPPGETEALAKYIKKLMEDTALYQEMSRNALEAFKEDFDASVIYREYAEYVERMAVGYVGT